MLSAQPRTIIHLAETCSALQASFIRNIQHQEILFENLQPFSYFIVNINVFNILLLLEYRQIKAQRFLQGSGWGEFLSLRLLGICVCPIPFPAPIFQLIPLVKLIPLYTSVSPGHSEVIQTSTKIDLDAILDHKMYLLIKIKRAL